MELQRLGPGHEAAVLAFEVANRAYFAASISDRGEEYFADFAARHAREVEEHEGGECAYFVLVDEGGDVVGRFNLRDIESGSAVLGYRVAQAVSGRGLASSTVARVCAVAAARLGVGEVRAATADANVASRRVLEKAGFRRAGPAEPGAVGGRSGHWYVRTAAEPQATRPW
ncbi:GNAT family N-acetyltransferase [Nocardioides anomalus]|uniref:GNAT family N-acetyltransferase n=1 Tax=Nocardioides anomalus TaxID=2712223 RepID=A0A6G6WFD7_9ACTN|nr:GNAT family protein [Nocardioides anomalus]QIG44048.1 GNAT family N-acetyltransferase [Nocardioides anomalus]